MVFILEGCRRNHPKAKVRTFLPYACLLTLILSSHREVNAIRRTGKDLLTIIPFTIILIIPLTPVGHVLAFSFIQKFFPDFFPSFFTEKRLNLKKLFQEIESKSGDDDLDRLLGADDSQAEKIDIGNLWKNIPSVSKIFKSLQSDNNQ